MPRPKSIIPTYRLHKSSGQAVAYVNRREVYLGPFGSAESREAYAVLLERLRQGETNVRSGTDKSAAPVFTLNDLFLRFATEELPKYSSAEQRCMRGAIRTARDLFSVTIPAADTRAGGRRVV